MRNRQHGQSRLLARASVALFSLVWVGCADHLENPAAPETAVEESFPDALERVVDCGPDRVFDSINFSNSTTIDNQWLPLIPGTQFIFEGEADRGEGLLPHQVIFTVTDMTKVINGVRTLVLWDRDINEGELSEEELAFYAQDNDGNVWNLGEYPEEFEDGEFEGAPNTWLAGFEGAEAGIHMLGNPQLGDRHNQGFAPDINFLDCAKVVTIGQKTCVPYNGCNENVLVVEERSPFDDSAISQRKHYAAGIGNILVRPVADPEGELLMLVEVRQLRAEKLEKIRREVRRLDRRGRAFTDVYRLSEPVEPLNGNDEEEVELAKTDAF